MQAWLLPQKMCNVCQKIPKINWILSLIWENAIYSLSGRLITVLPSQGTSCWQVQSNYPEQWSVIFVEQRTKNFEPISAQYIWNNYGIATGIVATPSKLKLLTCHCVTHHISWLLSKKVWQPVMVKVVLLPYTNEQYSNCRQLPGSPPKYLHCAKAWSIYLFQAISKIHQIVHHLPKDIVSLWQK